MPDRYLPGVPCWIELAAPDPGTAVARVLAAGGQALPGGLADPQGATFAVADRGGAELVNAPGTWNWSNLEGADVASAESF